MIAQLAGSAGKQFVRGMAALDTRLEHAGILKELNDQELSSEATEGGEETTDYYEVHFPPLPAACRPASPGALTHGCHLP